MSEITALQKRDTDKAADARERTAQMLQGFLEALAETEIKTRFIPQILPGMAYIEAIIANVRSSNIVVPSVSETAKVAESKA